jgi:hypothetical protein
MSNLQAEGLVRGGLLARVNKHSQQNKSLSAYCLDAAYGRSQAVLISERGHTWFLILVSSSASTFPFPSLNGAKNAIFKNLNFNFNLRAVVPAKG